MNNTGNAEYQVKNCHGCKWHDRYKEDGRGYCCMVERSEPKEKLIGVGFGSIGKNSCSDEKKNRPLK